MLLSESARAKINLTLRVVGRRADGYHELESLVVFADLADTLTLQPGRGKLGRRQRALRAGRWRSIRQSGAEGAARAGRERRRPQRRPFALDKRIPVAAGIGGGSADAAAALRLLARLNDLDIDDARLMLAALRTGADVPVCLASRACLMTGVGERLSPPLDLPPLHAVLVNPRVALSTRDVFSVYAAHPITSAALPHDVPRDLTALIAYLHASRNDLTEAAISRAPVVADVLDALGAQPGACCCRGCRVRDPPVSHCFRMRPRPKRRQQLGAAHKEWWVAPAVLD